MYKWLSPSLGRGNTIYILLSLFADDTTAQGFADEAQELKKFLNKELTKFSQWFFGNKLLAYQQKTVYVTFFANRTTPPLSLYLNGHKLDFKTEKIIPTASVILSQFGRKFSKDIININS